jgi:hypothetical protein
MESDLLPITYLFNRFLFPRCSTEIPLQIRSGVHLAVGQNVVVYPVRSSLNIIFPSGGIATLAEVVKVIDGKGVPMVELRGIKRVRIRSRRKFSCVRVDEIGDFSPAETDDRAELIRKKAQEFVFLINIPESDRLIYLMTFIRGLSDITDFVSHYFIIDISKKRRIYRITDPVKRSVLLEKFLDGMINRISGFNQRMVKQ